MKKDGERVLLTVKEALDIIPDGKEVHTFRNNVFMLIGANWSRESLEKYIKDSGTREIGGDMCLGMGHGLVLLPKGAKSQREALFVAHDKERIKKYL